MCPTGRLMGRGHTFEGFADSIGAKIGVRHDIEIPEAHHRPTHRLQQRFGFPVASPVPLDLRVPVGAGVWPDERGVAVPVSSVDEDGNSRPAERNIRATRQSSQMASVPEERPTPESHSKQELRPGVLRPNCRHNNAAVGFPYGGHLVSLAAGLLSPTWHRRPC